VSKWIVWLSLSQDYITHDRPALEVIQTNKTQIGLLTDYILVKLRNLEIAVAISLARSGTVSRHFGSFAVTLPP